MKTITYTIAFLLLVISFSSCTAEEIKTDSSAQTSAALDTETQIVTPRK
jgi:hypothetical protein